MKNIFLLLWLPSLLFSQVNFSEDISPIIYNNCTECHREGGAVPMSFTSYEEVASLGSMVAFVTQSGYMPPWHSDPNYSHFIGERVLTNEEKQLISDWVAGGMVQGDPSLEASIPNFPEGSVIGVPDAVFTMEEEYLVEGNNQDDYRVFVFSTNFSEDKYLQSIEIIPGNLSAVHHVLVNIDTEGVCAALDASTPEYGYECESGFCVGNIPQLSAGYTPGTVPPKWNNDIGLVLPAGADIAIQIHYAPSSIDEYDQTSVNLFFKEQPVEREVEVLTLIDTQLFVPANEIYTHYNSYTVPIDMSIISVLPHMHLIGKSWLIYAENNGDTIPIISIPDWDFNWQTFYQPEYMLKIPEGYTLHAYATYDNTSTNPTNPNSPPQDMFWCDYTTCEMFFLPFAYVPYQEGDEDTYLGDEDDLGCMDPSACNYNSNAIIQDFCDWISCEGCMDPIACDFDPDATIPSDCYVYEECYGCIDPLACNYGGSAITIEDGSCEYETCVGCLSEEACNFCSECTIPGECDYSCYGCMDVSACNYDSDATVDLGCDYSCIGCTIPFACNYNPNATISNNDTCGLVDDCGVCHIPCCYNLDTQMCDYSILQEDCTNYWADIEEVASDLNPYWNNCISGCTDSVACNFNSDATEDNGLCDYSCWGCIDENACNYGGVEITFNDGSCEYPDQYYDCNGNCLNDINENNLCDEYEQEDCSELIIMSIYQNNSTQYTVNVVNSSWDNIFSYPGFILFNSLGDTIAIENVDYYAIVEQNVHYLEIQEDVLVTPLVSLQLYTGFYDYLQCQWDNLAIIDNCELIPEPGECDAAIPTFYFNQFSGSCEEVIWGGCNGVVPFWNLEDCEEACGSVEITEFNSSKRLVHRFDILGRNTTSDNGLIIKLYHDGSVDKEFILNR